MVNIGRQIDHDYCNGFFGRDNHDLSESVIEAEGFDWVVIRKSGEAPQFAHFPKGLVKQKFVDKWCTGLPLAPK